MPFHEPSRPGKLSTSPPGLARIPLKYSILILPKQKYQTATSTSPYTDAYLAGPRLLALESQRSAAGIK